MDKINKETRIKKIEEAMTEANLVGRQELPWMDTLQAFSVYKIPLEYLVYNKYNGRILSRTLSLERQGHEIDATTKSGSELIAKLLYESKKDRNDKTLKSLERFGQEKIGIITKDGIIIDGNRRAMLLNKIKRFDYFKAVVLPVTLEQNHLEIEKLETSYQMGEDEKLGYNPIEKYLKAKGLYEQLHQKPYDSNKLDEAAIGKIFDWMGEDRATVIEYLDVMKTMDDYLEYLGYDGIYTQLDGREDPFIHLTKWIKTLSGDEPSAKGFDGYKTKDVTNLQMIAFDYIRAKYEGKKFRILAHGRRESHFFGDKVLWSDFKEQHQKNINPIIKNEVTIDFNSENLVAHLNDRDQKYREKAADLLDYNIEVHMDKLRNRQEADQPIKLVKKATQALEAIDQDQDTFNTTEVLDQMEALVQMSLDLLQDKSLERMLGQIINSLKSIQEIKDKTKLESLKEQVFEIFRLSNGIKSKLGE